MSEVGLPYEDFDRSCECLAEAGYDGVEIKITGERLQDPEEVARLGDVAADHGLEIPTVMAAAGHGTALSDPDDTVRADRVEAGSEIVELAADVLDVEAILLVPGGVTEDVPYDVAHENSLSSVRELAGVAAEHDVPLAIENVWNDFLLSPLEFASFVDDVGGAGPVGAYFDVGNILAYGYPEQWIDILGDRIEKVHVKDYDTDIDTIQGFTYPTQGDVPWEAVEAALDDVGYDDWITFEVSPYPTGGERMPGQVLENLRAVFA